ncbi:unnamed protein product [Symbiodinium pilosum]|uniref:Uncharacterized protein n=1 Tax=Symbiodinium pilosum TaxID=2952 RepID=A0A812XXS9_SYMPI|nr:unnamed protein product [Symbiodinium pilosum]
MSQSKYVGFLGGANKFGRWIPEPEIKARAVAGGATIDFSQALFVHPVITVHARAFWGGVTLVVPPNVTVEQNGRAILGGFGDGGGVFHSSQGAVPETLANSGVTIRIVGTAVMGSVNAVVNRKARPGALLTMAEAAAKMQDPPEPSTTREDMRQQMLGDVLAARAAQTAQAQALQAQALQAQAMQAQAIQQALGAHQAQQFQQFQQQQQQQQQQLLQQQQQQQQQAIPVVQGVPVPEAKA